MQGIFHSAHAAVQYALLHKSHQKGKCFVDEWGFWVIRGVQWRIDTVAAYLSDAQKEVGNMDDELAERQGVPAIEGGVLDEDTLPPMLLGTYTPKIDAKGRIALPAKFRTILGKGVVLTRGQERCIYLLPFREFRRMAVQLQRTSVSNKEARDYSRVLMSGASDQVPDKQGRVLVPPQLREYAHLNSDIVIIGVGSRAEIWDANSWEEYLVSKEQGYSDVENDILPVVDF